MGEGANGSRADRLVDNSGVAEQDFPAASLYVVALPIGNAADLSVRAWWVLSHADAIAAEDTRTTRPLLARFGIDAPLMSAHRHNERAAAQAIVGELQRGARVALVTDAGTPAISDPGALIVQAVADAGFRVIPIPGASSVIAALSIAGLAEPAFHFTGFLPTAARERERALRVVLAIGDSVVLLEAPHRIRALAGSLRQLSQPARRVMFARELTKKFETIVRCTAATIDSEALEERGEYVVVVERAPVTASDGEISAETRRWLQALLAELPPARAAAIAAHASGHRKEELYALALQLKASTSDD